MSSKTRIHFATILSVAICSFHPSKAWSQSFIDQWANQTLERMEQADFVSFNEANPTWYDSTTKPNINDSVPELDRLELALIPWGENLALENRCVQALLEGNMLRLQLMHVMKGLYASDIVQALEQTDIPVSFQWVPILASSYNHASSSQEDHAGLWGLSEKQAEKAEVLVNSIVDERMLPQASTAASVQLLDRLQRRFPENPERVLVGFIKGMPFASRWSGKPGYDPYVDEWLALFRVVARFMVNLGAQDFESTWGSYLTTWLPISCTQSINRDQIRENIQIPKSIQLELLPWWRGDDLTCAVFDEYQPYLPREWALQWEKYFTDLSPQQPLPEDMPFRDEAGSRPVNLSKETSPPPLQPCAEYQVKKGDTLYNIAKRFSGITPEDIASRNRISGVIKIGQILCIPRQE